MTTPSAVLAVIRAARPRLGNNHDRIAFAVHSILLSTGFRLVAVGEAASEDPPDEGKETDVGLDGWNDLDSSYAFRYTGDGDLPSRLAVKCLALGDLLVVDAAPIPGGQLSALVHSEIKVDDFAAKGDSTNYAELYTNLEALVDKISKDLVEPLTSTRPASTRPQESQSEQPRAPLQDPPVGAQPYLPRGGYGDAAAPPLGIGAGDLLPGGSRGIAPPGFGGMRGGGGGMMLGPNDPLWGQRGGAYPGMPPGGLPPGVPPGARFDPFGPPGVPGFEPDRFIRGGRRPSGGPPSHPDLEQFRDD